MAKTWFPHEDPLKEGEESQPLFGRRFSPFWFLGMLILIVGFVMMLWMSCSFVFSRPPSS
jgi:hypothetical protein